MNIQTKYSALFSFLILLQVLCIYKSQQSDKPIKRYISKVNLAVTIPILASLIIIGSHNKLISIIGYYIYYVGMTILMVTLVYFTNAYCQGVAEKRDKPQKPTVMYILGTIDLVQLLILGCFKQVFRLDPVLIEGKIYYKSVALTGLVIHRVIDYSIFGAVVLIYVIGIIKSSKLYREKFTIILVTLFISGIVQAYYMTVRVDIDKSVIIHSVFSIILFYFAIYHRPLRLLDTMLSNIVSDMNDALYIFDSSNKCVWANDVGYKLLNIPQGKVSDIKSAIKKRFGDLENQGDNWQKDLFLPENKEFFVVEKKSVKTDNKLLDGSYLIIKDSTHRRRMVEKELYNNTHDKLTGLYNMQFLYSSISKMLHTMNSIGQQYYVVYINIKNFKIVNDIFGKKFGDQVLVEFANWIKENIKGSESLYGRLIGDTFGLFMPVENFDEELFLNKFSKFIVDYEGLEHQIFIHVGVYKIVNKTMDISIMFDRAHLAVANNTDKYKTIISYYDDKVRNNILEEQKLITGLERAIQTNQIVPYLQPITDIKGNVVGAEALARWIHPEYGFMPPYKFIPIFERNGLIAKIDTHIWKCACETLQKWKDIGIYKDLFISINISPKDFYFVDIVKELSNLIQEYEINPRQLRIEITETVMMTDFEEKIPILNKLRELGFIVEIDDFGSGYSSLSMLKDMPADVLKIDMKFLSNENQLTKSQTIIKNVINLSNDLNITSLTEGVETEQQFKQLVDMGCTLFQGYYFAKPMSIQEFEFYVSERGGQR